MKALTLILITSGKVSEATAHIWVVSVSGDKASRVYCKSPYKAMRYAFLLKKRTGLNISDNCLCRVSHEIARGKVVAASEAEQPIELIEMDKPLTSDNPKPKRKATTKRPSRKRAVAASA